MKTVALFGGSFDPPHIGHEAIVKELLKLSYIDEVVIMPTYLNPFKKSFYADAKLRLNWLKSIFNNYKNITICDYEVKQNRQVTSIESVKYLLKSYSHIYLVIGADNLSSLHKWKNYNELKKLVTFIVASRDEIEIDKSFKKLHIDYDISSTQLRNCVDISYIPKQCAKEIEQFYKEKNAKHN